MGWSFSYVDIGRKAHIENLCRASRFSAGYTLLESRTVGNHIWHLLLVEATGRKMIALDLIAKDRSGGWGEKGMDEDWGPCYYDCPLSLLDQATQAPEGGHAEGWRAKVRAYHELKKALKKRLTVGSVIEYGKRHYRLTRNLGRKGWEATRDSDGMQFRMKARQVASSVLVN